MSWASIVFDYGVPAESLGPARGNRDNLARPCRARRRALEDVFDPADLLSELRAAGFTGEEDFDAATLNAHYFRRSGRRLEPRRERTRRHSHGLTVV
jgi:hypothetical protein